MVTALPARVIVPPELVQVLAFLTILAVSDSIRKSPPEMVTVSPGVPLNVITPVPVLNVPPERVKSPFILIALLPPVNVPLNWL